MDEVTMKVMLCSCKMVDIIDEGISYKLFFFTYTLFTLVAMLKLSTI
jgi:hypothetical protein